MAIKAKQFGLTLGAFLAIVHAIWALGVAVVKQPMQNFLDWIFQIHFMQPYWILTEFNIGNAVLLVVMTFIIGYIFGWLLATLWNKFGKK